MNWQKCWHCTSNILNLGQYLWRSCDAVGREVIPTQRAQAWIQASVICCKDHLFTVDWVEKTKINKKRSGLAHYSKNIPKLFDCWSNPIVHINLRAKSLLRVVVVVAFWTSQRPGLWWCHLCRHSSFQNLHSSKCFDWGRSRRGSRPSSGWGRASKAPRRSGPHQIHLRFKWFSISILLLNIKLNAATGRSFCEDQGSIVTPQN